MNSPVNAAVFAVDEKPQIQALNRTAPILPMLPTTHQTPAVHKWLLRHRRLRFRFTPTYGSWTNLVERRFSALTTTTRQRSAHPSVNALAADIIDWVEHWNENPTPFVWHKTADEILERLGRYCADLTTNEFIEGSA